jgi:hypothetical protein
MFLPVWRWAECVSLPLGYQSCYLTFPGTYANLGDRVDARPCPDDGPISGSDAGRALDGC